jgi:hypothetical protein
MHIQINKLGLDFEVVTKPEELRTFWDLYVMFGGRFAISVDGEELFDWGPGFSYVEFSKHAYLWYLKTSRMSAPLEYVSDDNDDSVSILWLREKNGLWQLGCANEWEGLVPIDFESMRQAKYRFASTICKVVFDQFGYDVHDIITANETTSFGQPLSKSALYRPLDIKSSNS